MDDHDDEALWGSDTARPEPEPPRGSWDVAVVPTTATTVAVSDPSGPLLAYVGAFLSCAVHNAYDRYAATTADEHDGHDDEEDCFGVDGDAVLLARDPACAVRRSFISAEEFSVRCSNEMTEYVSRASLSCREAQSFASLETRNAYAYRDSLLLQWTVYLGQNCFECMMGHNRVRSRLTLPSSLSPLCRFPCFRIQQSSSSRDDRQREEGRRSNLRG